MIISALKTSVDTDSRSPIHIDTISTLLNLGADVFFEENIGIGINVSHPHILTLKNLIKYK